MSTAVNVATLPKSSVISPDLYYIGIRNPDGAATTELILAQSAGGGGSGGTGKILVNSTDTIFPQRSRLKLGSSILGFLDDAANDQTLLTFNTSTLMLKSTYDSNNNGIIDIQSGGTGLSVPPGVPGLFGVGNSSTPVLYRTNFSATTQPGPNNDSTQGYTKGSRWIFGNDEWLCTSSTPSNAIWVKTTGGGEGGGGSAFNIQAGGINLPNRTNLNFLGSGLTLIYDDATNDATVIQIEQGDMLKSVFDSNLDGKVDPEAGGTGLNLSTSYEGYLYSVPLIGSPPIVLRQSFGTFSDPSPSSDSDIGYGSGSLWLNKGSESLWYNVDPQPNLAKWVRLGKNLNFFDGNSILPYKEDIKFVGFDISQSPTNISIKIPPPTVDWVTHPSGTNLLVRDSLHGKTIKLSGTLQVLCPSATTETVRDGFQINLILTTDSSTVTFLPEGGGTVINGRTNILNTRWGAVHLSYEASTNSWFLVGHLT